MKINWIVSTEKEIGWKLCLLGLLMLSPSIVFLDTFCSPIYKSKLIIRFSHRILYILAYGKLIVKTKILKHIILTILAISLLFITLIVIWQIKAIIIIFFFFWYLRFNEETYAFFFTHYKRAVQSIKNTIIRLSLFLEIRALLIYSCYYILYFSF